MTAPTDASVYSNLSGLAALKADARAQDPNALRQVAKQFESVFAKMMLTSMRQATSSFGDPLFGSDQTQFVQGMFDDQLSIEMTKGRGLGLADMLVRQLQRATGTAPTADAKSPELKIPARGFASAPSPETAQYAAADLPLRGGKGVGAQESALSSAASAAAASAAGAWENTLSGEPYAIDPSAALHVATQFISNMLAGNAAANGEGAQFKTPTSPEDFVQQLWPCAEAAGRELGIDPKNLLAQAALETGWGKSLPCDADGNSSYNFFGIKAGGEWQGDSVSVKTLEFEGGLPVPRQARFRSYDSAADSFRDYVSVLRDNPRYAAALNTGKDAKAFATALQRGGYATDPAYAQKIASIAQNLGNSAMALKSADPQPIPSPPDTR